ncbi:glycosyltransferase [Oenococcus alcoholitolerans]|uniref:glycosyltransferase n=1 Tax=Oenococcus alcoholitolerans TaxID=931074 RepID=UPI003F71C7A0
MIFFINSNMQKNKSGIEHAELKRAQLFDEFKTNYCFLLLNWSVFLHKDLKEAGLKDDQVINLFDYFQGFSNVKEKILTIDDLDFGSSKIRIEPDLKHNRFLVWKTDYATNLPAKEYLAERVNLFSDSADKRVFSRELFDQTGNIYTVDFYDWRGFKTMSQWYDQHHQVAVQSWFGRSGAPVVDAFFRNNAQGDATIYWRLRDHSGQIHIFSSVEKLQRFFLDSINDDFFDKERPNIFIFDRAELGDWALKKLRRPAYSVFYLHSSHTVDSQNAKHSLLNNNYEYAFWNLDSYDAIAASTDKQAEDVKERFLPNNSVLTIPVGSIPDIHFKKGLVETSKRRKNSIVVFARISAEKQLDQLLFAVDIARKKIKNISLDIYGYRDSTNNFQTYRQLLAIIKDRHLENNVAIHNYTEKVDQIESQAQVFAVTSAVEGFDLALMEALSNGLVGLSYRVNYGPNQMIKQGENGFLVDAGDYRALADRMIELFSNDVLLSAMSKRAFEYSQDYSNSRVYERWSKLFLDAKEKWNLKMLLYKNQTHFGLGENGSDI